MIPIPSAPAGRWRRCSRWARSRSLSWRTPPTRPEGSLTTAISSWTNAVAEEAAACVLIYGAGDALAPGRARASNGWPRGGGQMDLPVDDDAATLSDYAD